MRFRRDETLIPPKKNRKEQRDYDKYLYKMRHLVESCFLVLKRWRGIITCYAKTLDAFIAAVHVRCIAIWFAIRANPCRRYLRMQILLNRRKGSAMLIYLQVIDDPTGKSKFEELYIQHKQLMFYIANKILNNEYYAEDAGHQAFLSIAKNIEKILELEDAKTKSYLVTTTEHCAIDIYRIKKRKSTVPLNEDILGLTFEPPSTGTVAEAIAKLPARYRNVIMLKYDCGYTNQEIAEILDISYEGVHSLVQRAKRRLKVLLEEEGISI